ncbi:50S ribosomal protein L5 [Candidatus Kaiserbacteria bacterium CG10_big_fil_rev_8_21_14_0_10_49_17]|uniref:Large ribosomal subunit protein uL5 n=1 Tax=Candidatus Kaiserbacteria bacterium CG10_big_fil_rev_8_21_14_0_10_49_17 TaxID=1974609 RepID=A0A2M6WEI1_9BACT|nr:MAG: 50S ribosomal protein L5 [Candidatus Kaiserbacteria bacterium CG10_big_fil_rev_8_21_14_0_10_49_17]
MQITRTKQKNMFQALKDTLGLSNAMQTPKVVKVVVSTGVGRVKDKKKMELIADRLAVITGQKPSPRPAKKSEAAFKVRQGETVGYQVTLRGSRMYDFLEKLIHIALPRTRDFRGITRSAVDEMGNLTIGIKEHTIFPETSDEDIRDVFGLAVTLVSNAGSREEALAFFTELGVPFKKEDTEE